MRSVVLALPITVHLVFLDDDDEGDNDDDGDDGNGSDGDDDGGLP